VPQLRGRPATPASASSCCSVFFKLARAAFLPHMSSSTTISFGVHYELPVIFTIRGPLLTPFSLARPTECTLPQRLRDTDVHPPEYLTKCLSLCCRKVAGKLWAFVTPTFSEARSDRERMIYRINVPHFLSVLSPIEYRLGFIPSLIRLGPALLLHFLLAVV